MTREPQTEAGRRLNDDYLAGPGGGGIGPYTPDIIAIETEAWNAALQAVEEALDGFTAEAQLEVHPQDRFLDEIRGSVAALRKPAALDPKEPS